MRLNLAMVALKLDRWTPSDRQLQPGGKRKLRYPVLFDGGVQLQSDRLYVVKAENLKDSPEFAGVVSMVVLGDVGPAYRHELCEFLCLPENTPIIPLFNRLLEIFDEYAVLDRTADRLCQAENPFEALGGYARELLENPVRLTDCHGMVMLYSYDESKGMPYSREYMEQFLCTGTYVPNPNPCRDREGFLSPRPQLGELPMNGKKLLYKNLWHFDQYLGFFQAEAVYRDFRDGDYGILDWLGSKFYRLLAQTGDLYFGRPIAFARMMKDLVEGRVSFRPEHQRILAGQNWERGDLYLCTVTVPLMENSNPGRMARDALYFNAYFDEHHILLLDNAVVEIMNLTRSNYSVAEYKRRLELYLKSSNAVAGCGVAVRDLGSIRRSFRQAWDAAQRAMKGDQPGAILDFSGCVLDSMLDRMTQDWDVGDFCSDAIRKLVEYDEKNGGDLLDTLECYLLHERSVPKVQEYLQIARTTVLYRVRRIQQITGLDLDSADTRLYLLLMFRLGKENPWKNG